MRVALGADHAGVVLKNSIKQLLDQRGIVYTDFGTGSTESVDYPDYATLVGRSVVSGEHDRGILVCGTGLGMAMAANKIPGIRAAPVLDETSTRLGREHNDANVLALGARITAEYLAWRLVEVFLDTPFAGGRHQRRLDKMAALDRLRDVEAPAPQGRP